MKPSGLLALLLLVAGAEARDADAPARLFDPAGLGLIRTVVPGGDPVGLAFSPDGRRLAVGVGNGAVLFETEGWRELRRLEGHPDALLSLAWSPDGATLAGGGMEGTIAVWDVQGGAVKRTFQAHASHLGVVQRAGGVAAALAEVVRQHDQHGHAEGPQREGRM